MGERFVIGLVLAFVTITWKIPVWPLGIVAILQHTRFLDLAIGFDASDVRRPHCAIAKE